MVYAPPSTSLCWSAGQYLCPICITKLRPPVIMNGIPGHGFLWGCTPPARFSPPGDRLPLWAVTLGRKGHGRICDHHCLAPTANVLSSVLYLPYMCNPVIWLPIRRASQRVRWYSLLLWSLYTGLFHMCQWNSRAQLDIFGGPCYGGLVGGLVWRRPASQ